MKEKIRTAVSYINQYTRIRIKSYTIDSSGFTMIISQPIEMNLVCDIDESIVGTEYELAADILEAIMTGYVNHLYGDLGGDLEVDIRHRGTYDE